MMTESAAEYWNRFYRSWDFSVPSQFAALVATELPSEHGILELGCGNGRDALFMAGLGHAVLALDQSEAAVEGNRARAARLGLSRLTFQCAHAGTPEVIAAAVRHLVDQASGAPLAAYARFFFHAIPAEDERAIIAELGRTLPSGSRCFFEFRSTRDAETRKLFGEHYRRFIDVDAFVEICGAAGFATEYAVTGQGMAKFRDEDPWVGRVILARRATE